MPDVEKVIEGLEMSYKYSNVDENNTLVPQWIVLHALALLKAQEPVVMAGAELTDAELIEKIRKAPIVMRPNVDAVPVVRCRDCKYGKLCFDADGHGLIQCTNTNYPAANVETWPIELDWYCAGGERRDNDAAD